jgi:Domain of unknown function (DUF4328)
MHPKLRWAAIAIAIASGCELLALGNRYTLLTSVNEGTFTGTMEDLTNSDNYVLWASGVGLIAGATFSIMLMVWVHRATKYLNSNHVSTAKSPRWAVGSFFIPIAHAFLVYGTLKDLVAGLGRIHPTITYTRYSSVRVFWILMTIGNYAGRAVFSSDEYDTFDAYKTAEGWGIIACIVLLVGSLYAVRAFGRLREDIN